MITEHGQLVNWDYKNRYECIGMGLYLEIVQILFVLIIQTNHELEVSLKNRNGKFIVIYNFNELQSSD